MLTKFKNMSGKNPTVFYGMIGIENNRPVFIDYTDANDMPDLVYTPNDWKNVQLIQRNYAVGIDIMRAFTNEPSDGFLFTGLYNDGCLKD